MRLSLLPILALLIAAPVLAQSEFAGTWSGDLDQSLVQPGAPVVPLIVHFAPDGDGYTATYDTPTQSTFGVPVDSVFVDGPTVRAVLVPIGGEFVGTMSDDGLTIVGVWSQGPAELPLVLTPRDDLASGGEKSTFKPDDLSGKWTGAIARSTGGEARIHLVFTRQEDGSYTAGYIPPGQSTPIDLGPIVLDGDSMTLQIGAESSFTGTVSEDESTIEGLFGQGGEKRPMTLTRD